MTSTRRSRAGFVAVALTVLLATPPPANSAPRAAGPRSSMIGQITASGRETTIPVVILRGAGEERNVKPGAPLYPRDRIYLTKRDATAEIEFFGGEAYTMQGKYNYDEKTAYVLPDAPPGSNWTDKSFKQLIGLGSWVMFPPKARAGRVTTADGPKGAVAAKLKPATFLPATAQKMRASSGQTPLPVVWRGGAAQVRLLRDCRSVIVEDTSTKDGFLELVAPGLRDGEYCVEVAPVNGAGSPDRKAGFSIPVTVAAGPTPPLEEEAAVMQAVKGLKGPAAGRLQALSDLDRLSRRSFKAWMVFRGIAAGGAQR